MKDLKESICKQMKRFEVLNILLEICNKLESIDQRLSNLEGKQCFRYYPYSTTTTATNEYKGDTSTNTVYCGNQNSTCNVGSGFTGLNLGVVGNYKTD